MALSETDEKEIYRVIHDSLVALCEQKPNDPVDFLVRTMLEIIGEDSEAFFRDKTQGLETNKVIKEVIIKADKIAEKQLTENFYDFYQIVEELTPDVYLIQEVNTENEPDKVARILPVSEFSNIFTEGNIKSIMNLDFPNISKVFHIFQDEKYYYVVYDYCKGKDILTFLHEHKEKVSQALIRDVLRQILLGINFLHGKGFIHKTLGASKIMVYDFDKEIKNVHIKIVDYFIGCEKYCKNTFIHKSSGKSLKAPLYFSPEYIEGNYNEKMDIWSYGIIAYILLTGKIPYNGKNTEILYQITNVKIKFPEINEIKLSFLKDILNYNSKERPSAEELLKHEYFTTSLENISQSSMDQQNSKGVGELGQDELVDIMNCVGNFAVGSNLRRSIISYIQSKKLYKENDQKIRILFSKLDKNGDGNVSVEEIYKNYRQLFPGTKKSQWKKIKKFVEHADIDKSGTIEYSEFLTIMSLTNKEQSEEVIRSIFNYFDDNRNGYIEAKDLRELFENTDVNDKEFQDMIDEVDKNGDRKISYEEFYQILTKEVKSEEQTSDSQTTPINTVAKDALPKEEQKAFEEIKEENEEKDKSKEDDIKTEGNKQEEYANEF